MDEFNEEAKGGSTAPRPTLSEWKWRIDRDTRQGLATGPNGNDMDGMEWIVDAEGCLAASLCDLARLREICERAVVELRLKVVGEPLWHQFPGTGGLTGMYLLSESHLTCHSFPEHGTVTFNLFCCSTRPEWNWAEVLSAELDAARVHVRSVSRKICAEHAAAKVHP